MRPPVGEQSKPPRKLSEVQELHVGQTPQTGEGGKEMIIRTSVTRGKLETTRRRGKEIKSFLPSEEGNDCEIYIKFDNGSILGYTQSTDVEAYIAKAAREFEELPTSEQY
jgi:hypothetical protein